MYHAVYPKLVISGRNQVNERQGDEVWERVKTSGTFLRSESIVSPG